LSDDSGLLSRSTLARMMGRAKERRGLRRRSTR
jgi:hypothetical protein